MESLDFSKLLKRWWVIVVAMLIGALAAVIIAKTQASYYQVQARLLVGPGIDSPRPDLNVLRASGQLIQTYAELPQTEPFLQETITELQLADMEPEDLAAIISVRPNPETQILTIEVDYEDPAMAQAIAYHIAEKLVRLSPSNPESTVAQMKGQVQSQVAELEQTVVETRNNLRQLENDYQLALEEDRLQRESAGSDEAISKQLDQFEENNDLIASAATQREAGVQILEELVSNTNARILQFEFQLAKTTNSITQKVLSDQIRDDRNHLSDLRQAIAEINRPIEGVPLDQYIATLQAQLQSLEDGLDNIINLDIRRLQFDRITQIQAKLSQARAIEGNRQEMILNEIADERERISDVSLSRIENQRAILEKISSERSRLSEMQNTLALLYSSVQDADPNQVKILELAKPIQVTPPMSLMAIVGALAGAILAAVGILGSGYLAHQVENAEQVSSRVQAPVIDLDKGHSPVASVFQKTQMQRERLQMYQKLGMRLLYGHTGTDRKLVLVGSTDEHTDAGIVASNLAIFLSQTGKRVILVDANPDQPTIASHFRLEQREGLSDFLAGSLKKYLPVTSIDQFPSLGLLPFGSFPQDSAYLSTQPVISQLDRLKDRVDIVLVSVPVLLRPDSLALAAHASGVIIVVAKGKTSQHTLEEVVDSLKLVGAKILLAVLKYGAGLGETLEWNQSRDSLSNEDGFGDELTSRTAPDSSESGESVGNPVSW